MKLINAELIAKFAKTGRQDVKDPIVIAKFFNPCGRQSWYATEFCPDSKIFFGYVSLFGDSCDEWGSFSLEELESVKGHLGLGLERDLYCGYKPLSEHLKTQLKM